MIIDYNSTDDVIKLYHHFKNSKLRPFCIEKALMSIQVYKYNLLTPESLKYVETSMDIVNTLYETQSTNDMTQTNVCEKICLLKWVDNSCYADVVLVSLLLFSDKFIERELIDKNVSSLKNDLSCKNKDVKTKIQQSLIEMYKYFKTNGVCGGNVTFNNLRDELINCVTNDEDYNTFHNKEENDSRYFLNYILEMFEINKATHNTTTYVNGYMEVETQFNKPLVWNITSEELTIRKNNNYTNIGLFLIKSTDDNITFLEESPYTMFTLERKDNKNKWINAKILPTESLVLLNGQILSLSSIIVWKDNHYTSYVKCNNSWYYYDSQDNDSKLKMIGTYEEMILNTPENLPNVLTASVIVFYNEILKKGPLYNQTDNMIQEQEIKECEENIKKLKIQLEQNKYTIAKLQNKTDNATKENTVLLKKIKLKDDSISGYKKRIESKTLELNESMVKNKDLQMKYDYLTEYNTRISDEIEKHIDHIVELKLQLDENKDTINELKSQTINANKDIKELNDRIDQLNIRKIQTHKRINSLKTDILNGKTTIIQLGKEIEQIKNDNSIEKLSGDDMKQDMLEIENAYILIENTYKQIAEEKQHYQNKIEELQQKNNQMAEEKQHYQNKIKELQQKNKNISKYKNVANRVNQSNILPNRTRSTNNTDKI
ncbi:MAG: hypothetical protein ACW98X_11070 [Promethearchaeota archaeon]|jgi:hypothetical protein